MMIAARNAFLMGGAKLPYDVEVEYLESTGTQYIDTGVTFSNGVDSRHIEIDLAYTQSTSKRQLHGTEYGFAFGINANSYVFWPNSVIQMSLTPNRFYRIVHSANADQRIITTIDGTTVSDFTTVATYANQKIFLFNVAAPNGNPAADYYSTRCRIGQALIRKNSALVRDFIPVRVGSGSSAVGYLYDRANPTGGQLGNGLYPNAGTGAFVIGPDK